MTTKKTLYQIVGFTEDDEPFYYRPMGQDWLDAPIKETIFDSEKSAMTSFKAIQLNEAQIRPEVIRYGVFYEADSIPKKLRECFKTGFGAVSKIKYIGNKH